MIHNCYIHVDLDAFYASVEQIDNPEYKGKPVIVGSLPTDRRGVVSTCSYEARAYGVHSAMPIATAVKLCPHAVFLRGRMKRYQERSKEIMSIFSDFSPDVHQISVDEAFIDISGTERLFGSPAEVATSLKQRVLEQTGLTVSVGISSTKYIAKIASGIKKPDGLFIVEPGKEEEFMLQLPLKDIWGIGQKTLARIKEAGFKTSNDIHKVSQGMLCNLFGNSTGMFLFNAVRGEVYETFNVSPKTRSISSERTFSFDLTDRYAIDTALMELSWDVMFRLFTEKWTSRTAHVKIRYEDFTTVSVQETTLLPISSADDLFTRVKKLFEKKYENGRGIRLIGLAAQNLEDTAQPIQQELFEKNDKKIQAVEKTVIEIQKKNPGIQIQKARLLKNNILFLGLLSLSLLLPLKHIYSQSETPIALAKPFEDAFISGEAPIAIFNVTPDSPEVEFFAQGTWEAMFSNFLNISGGAENNEGLSFSPPVFTQKTDLSVWFLLQDTWYFEANIADNYEQNTVAAGYYGQGFLRHVRVGNRHITFPQDYGVTSADRGVGSGSNQAPGIMTEWVGSNWKADALIRFDTIESMEKTWLGQNESTENILELSQWERGGRFILPNDSTLLIQSIYVESSDTSLNLYTDTGGVSYRLMSPSEYLIIPNKNLLVFEKPTENAIVIKFTSKPDFGDFNNTSTYLGKIQEYFGEDIKLEEYALGSKSDDFFTNIDGGEALVIQTKNFFSPFVDASLYSLSIFADVDTVSIISESSGTTDKSYGAIIMDNSSPELPGFTVGDYFDDEKNYIQVFNQSVENNTIASQFPFANKHPLVYVTPESSENKTADTVIAVQSLSHSSVLDIGTEAIQGSITVYRNGIKESLYNYDSNTGLVMLTSPPGAFDTIRITWQENDELSSNGFLTAAAGFERVFSDQLSMNVSSSFLWPVIDSEAYSDKSNNSPASVNVAFDIDFQKNQFSLENTLLASIQTDDISDTYLIDGMKSISIEENYLPSSAGVELLSNSNITLNSRDYKSVEILQKADRGSETVNTLKDSERNENIVQTDWSITDTQTWVTQTIDLGTQATNLPSAQTFSIWIRDSSLATSYTMYLQLGVSSSDDELIERDGEVPTWEITPSVDAQDVTRSFLVGNTAWQRVTVELDDRDRARLTQNQGARIIIHNPDTNEGRLEVASYEITGNSFSIPSYGIEARELYQAESGKTELSEMTRFNDDLKNSVQFFEWDETLSTENLEAVKYVTPIPLSSYKLLTFFAYVPNEVADPSSVTLSLQQETEFSTETALKISLTKRALDLLMGAWNEVTIDIDKKALHIDNKEVPNTYYEIIELNDTYSPTKMVFAFEGEGSIYIDEIHLQDAIWEFASENILDVEWKHTDVLIGSDDFPIVSNASITSNIRAGLSTPLEETQKQTELGLVTDSNARINIMGIESEGSLVFSSSNIDSTLSNQNDAFFLQSASHSIASTPKFFVFTIFGFEEEYRFLPQSTGAKKREEFTLDLSPFGVNLQSSFFTEAEKESTAYNQDVQIKNNFSIGEEKLQYTVQAELFATQHGYVDNLTNNTYGSSWVDISGIQFSNGYSQANKRNIEFSLNQRFNIPSIKFTPYLSISGENNYSNILDVEHTSSDTLLLSLPISFDEHHFTASFTKTSFIESSLLQSNNYITDANTYFDTLNKRIWAYTAIPIYDFFDRNLQSEIQSTLENNASANIAGYSTEWMFNWQRDYFANSLDLIVPSSASLSVLRDIRASSIDTSDIFQFTTNLNFLSINNFGEFGTYPVFQWYEQDEIIQSIKASYQKDYDSDTNWRLSVAGYNQIGLYITTSDKLTILTEGQVDTSSAWNIMIDAIWQRDGKSSIVVDALNWIFPSLKDSQQGFTRENSLYAGLTKNETDEEEDNSLQQLYGITHEIAIDINEFTEFGIDLGAEIFIRENSFNLQNSLTLVGKIQF